MIACKTVSAKDKFVPQEFLKLRNVIKHLFPVVSGTAEIRYFGDDCYLYKLSGKNREKNIMLMSHHNCWPLSFSSSMKIIEWKAKNPGYFSSPCFMLSKIHSTQSTKLLKSEVFSEKWKISCHTRSTVAAIKSDLLWK